MKDMAAPDALERIRDLAASRNIAEDMVEDELVRLGDLVVREYRIDLASMEPWKKRMEAGLKLAALEKEAKTHPWSNPANVKYPLITTAVLMFNAKAYPAVVSSDQVVKASVQGADPDGAKAARGERVSAHMSWQLTNQIVEWEEETDKLLTLVGLHGTIVRKVWYDLAKKRTRVRNVRPGKFVVNENVAALEDSPRCTEELAKFPHEIRELIRSGEWREDNYIEAQGEDTAAPEEFLEQHRWIDLDKDGVDEPYIVTVHVNSQKVARIVADYVPADVSLGDDGKVASIRRGAYFVAYHFLPSMDGTFFSNGFGMLLGEISESINTLMNLLIDAGHMASLGGGFIGTEFRTKGGALRMRPGEWKLVNVPGSSVRESLVPLTYPGADATLFELLGLLIEAGKEVASVKDVLQGETGGVNMTATTTMALIEQGMAQFTAAYKRIFRSLKQEYALIARINRETVTPEEYNRFHDEMEPVPMPPQEGAMPPDGMGQPMGAEGMVPPMMGHNGGPPMQPRIYDPRVEYDLSDMDITPVADPASVTRMQEVAKAQMLMEMAQNGLVNPVEASKRALEAAAIGDVEELAPQPNPAQEAMAQAEIAEKQAHAALMGAQAQAEGATGAEAQARMAELQLKARIAEATLALKQLELQARQAETQAAAQSAMLEAPEKAAKIDLTRAQTAKVYSDIETDRASLTLDANQQAIDARAQADQADLARQQAAAGASQKAAEIEIKAEGQRADIEDRRRQYEDGAADRKAQTKLTEAQAKAAGKPKPKG